MLNNEIVTDSESEIPDLGKCNTREIVRTKIESIKCKVRRMRAKKLFELRLLKKKCSSRESKILHDFPDIGETIESYVQSCNVGADAWRRTGVLTFDGNIKVTKKCTYERIRQHLQSKYKHKFSYGTVVQLCIARNKRRLSARRYKGVAHVTSRRARKGFQLRLNPDSHWSSAFYRGLNFVQYQDGSNICNINRDDASGFRLDTLATHAKHSVPSVEGKEVLTTYTDYVNKYPSVLQTTSYNFSKTSTTEELFAGVVKAHGLFTKSPAQHTADLRILESKQELQSAFIDPDSGVSKEVFCIRVDGASDEGPSHEEVQFWWTDFHMSHRNLMTLLTTRSSGSSYLNRVELQNGCLALAHNNLFIPSTLSGSCVNSESGKIDQEVLRCNLELATEVYINRCDKCPCAKSVIHLFTGADSEEFQSKREALKIFLKGTKAKKEQLQREEPNLYSYFEKVWMVRNNHIVKGLPQQYIFFLYCCFTPTCPNPRCQDLVLANSAYWYCGGPLLKCIPLPIPDKSRPWGDVNCKQCEGFCAGHYLKPAEVISILKTSPFENMPYVSPPSTVLYDFFLSLNGKQPTELQVKSIARKVLLPTDSVKMWLAHLDVIKQNRKRGAIRAAATRRAKRSAENTQKYSTEKDGQKAPAVPSEVHVAPLLVPLDPHAQAEGGDQDHCGVCGQLYSDQTDEVENWIACDHCSLWFHWDCVNVFEEPKDFFCADCTCK